MPNIFEKQINLMYKMQIAFAMLLLFRIYPNQIKVQTTIVSSCHKLNEIYLN